MVGLALGTVVVVVFGTVVAATVVAGGIVVVGAMVVLVDHDMELVSATCGQVAVLDFGRVIANGPTREVLADPLVIRAYLGDDESVQA